jgi:hypothetical protein
VCARGDLDLSLPDARGCFDTKVTSYDLALQLQADAMSGPTTEVCSLPVCTETGRCQRVITSSERQNSSEWCLYMELL